MWIIYAIVVIPALVLYLGVLLFRHKKLEDDKKTSPLRMFGIVLGTIGAFILLGLISAWIDISISF